MKSDGNYRGLVAELYDLWFGASPFEDEAFYREKIITGGGSALEVACGTGRLLIPYVCDGLAVEGVDASPDMLALCRRKGAQQGLSPILYEQHMQALDLPRRYRTIYIPFGSFQILIGRDEAFAALQGFYAHLEPNGQLLVSLSIPWDDLQAKKQWRIRRSATRPSDGATVLVHEALRCNRLEQLQTSWLRYEIYHNGQLTSTELRTLTLRWYGKYEFTLMLANAGFHDVCVYGDYTAALATDQHVELVFQAFK